MDLDGFGAHGGGPLKGKVQAPRRIDVSPKQWHENRLKRGGQAGHFSLPLLPTSPMP